MCEKIVSCVLALMLSGCFVIRSTESEWRESEAETSLGGVGSQDMTFLRWANNKFEYDGGNRIAIGFFPGAGELWEKGSMGSGISNAWEGTDEAGWGAWVGCIIRFNFFATWDSLLVAPFVENELSVAGLVGCHRWRTKVGTWQKIKEGDSEIILRNKNQNECATNRMSRFAADAIGEFNDIKVYFEYPGCDKINDDVTREGRVGVMLPYGIEICRVFKRAEHVKDALTYEDVKVEDSEIIRQAIMYGDLVSIDNQLVALYEHEGYAFADSTIKASVSNLEERLEKQIRAIGGGTEGPIVSKDDAEQRLKQIKESLNGVVAKRKAELERRKADAIARCEEIKKRVVKMLDEKSFEKAKKVVAEEKKSRNMTDEEYRNKIEKAKKEGKREAETE